MQTRHPSVTDAARWLTHDHLPPGQTKDVSALYTMLRDDLLKMLPDDSTELTHALRALVVAKDAGVRAARAVNF